MDRQEDSRAARFGKSSYTRAESVTAVLDKLDWHILSKKKHKDATLILFYKLFNHLTQVPYAHIIHVAKAYTSTRKKSVNFLLSTDHLP